MHGQQNIKKEEENCFIALFNDAGVQTQVTA